MDTDFEYYFRIITDAVSNYIGIIFFLILIYFLLAIPYAFILRPIFLKVMGGKYLANKIKARNLKIKNLLKNEKKLLTEASLKNIIIKNFKVKDSFKGLVGLTFVFKGFENFSYTFHIKENDILVVCSSTGEIFGISIDFFVNKDFFEVRKDELFYQHHEANYYSLDKKEIENISKKLSKINIILVESYMDNLLKDEAYEYFEN